MSVPDDDVEYSGRHAVPSASITFSRRRLLCHDWHRGGRTEWANSREVGYCKNAGRSIYSVVLAILDHRYQSMYGTVDQIATHTTRMGTNEQNIEDRTNNCKKERNLTKFEC